LCAGHFVPSLSAGTILCHVGVFDVLLIKPRACWADLETKTAETKKVSIAAVGRTTIAALLPALQGDPWQPIPLLTLCEQPFLTQTQGHDQFTYALGSMSHMGNGTLDQSSDQSHHCKRKCVGQAHIS
jgi:hypothetical protein